MGLLDIFKGPQPGPSGFSPDIERMAKLYGIEPAAVQDMQKQRAYDRLGNIGATLLAAGQAGPIGQRGQILARLGQDGGGYQDELTAAQMARVRSTALTREEEAQARRAQAVQYLSQLTDLPEPLRRLAAYDPETALAQVVQIQTEQRARAEAERQAAEEAAREQQRFEALQHLFGGGGAPSVNPGGSGAPYSGAAGDVGTGRPSWLPAPAAPAQSGFPAGVAQSAPQGVIRPEEAAAWYAAGASPEEIAQKEIEARIAARKKTDPLFKIENNVGGEGDPLDKELAKIDAKDIGDITTQGRVSASVMGDMRLLEELNKQVMTGPIVGSLQRAFPGLSTNAQAFEAIVKRIAPQLRAPGSGSTSDIEYQGFLASLPTLSGLEGGNQLIIETMKRKAQIDQLRAAAATAYRTGGRTPEEKRALFQKLQELNSTPILTPEVRAIIEQNSASGILGTGIGGSEPPPPEGVDPGIWKYMTPEERALWQN